MNEWLNKFEWMDKNKNKDNKTDGSIIYSDGTKVWYKDGKKHREDGPAIIYPDGTKVWYKDGKKHRIDGPAIIYDNGSKFWYQNGMLHREDGPAIERANGIKMWYINGVEITEQEHNKRYKSKTIFTVTMIRNNNSNNRIVGWFENYDKAEYVVLHNVNDIQEHHYIFCVIEEMQGNTSYPGVPETEQWFKWYKNEKRFRPINKPEAYNRVVNFGIG